MKFFSLVLALMAFPVATSVTLKLVSGWDTYSAMGGLQPSFVLGFIWLVFFMLAGASVLGFVSKK
jgi:hypothetical protein